MLEKTLEYILEVEGDYIHRNTTEADITSPGGIYRKEHPDAAIFEYIDTVANSIGIDAPSTDWTDEDISNVNRAIDIDTIKTYLDIFYKEYLSGMHLELFPKELELFLFNIYTNSKIGTWKSIQRTLIHFQNLGILDINKKELSIVDGYYGSKTKNAIERIDFSSDNITNLFMVETLSNMRRYYADLVVSNPDKYLIYLKGWNNRLDNTYTM